MTARGALLKAAVMLLGEAWPRYLRVDDLLVRARGACGRGELDPATVGVFHRDVTAMFEADVIPT